MGEERVARLLAAIGGAADGEAGTWAAPDGRFRVGALTGRWTKPAAEYIGEGARETARRARIAALRTELDVLQGELDAVTTALDAVAVRRRTLDAELAAVTDEHTLTQAHAQVAAAAETVRRARTRREERAADLTAAAERAERAAAELAGTATDLGLPADRVGLAAVRDGLGSLAAVLAALWPALRERGEAAHRAEEEATEAGQAGERTAELALRAEEAGRETAAADERHATLRSTVGAAVAELQRRLAETAEALRTCEAEQQLTRKRHTEADRAAGKAEGRIEQLEKGLQEAAEARAEAIASLQRFTTTGLIAVALPELPVPATDGGPLGRHPRRLAGPRHRSGPVGDRRLGRRLGTCAAPPQRGTQDPPGHPVPARTQRLRPHGGGRHGRRHRLPGPRTRRTRTGRGAGRRGRRTHPHPHRTGAGDPRNPLDHRGRGHAPGTDRGSRTTGTGHERRAGGASHLHRHEAAAGVAGLPQGPRRPRPGQGPPPSVGRRLDPEDRAAVGAFLQAQIARQHTDDASGSWLEHLTVALDYRTWHEFGVERHQHGRWVPATGPASGGERVLAVSVPLFAAASAHYASAGSPYAPRLVTLDEAFAGVDDDSRAKCLGLLHAFDLDVVMTSEREWACYPQVPGIAIAQLSRIDEVAAVLVTRWEWDGTRRLRREDPVRQESTTIPAPRAEPAEAGPEQLWT